MTRPEATAISLLQQILNWSAALMILALGLVY